MRVVKSEVSVERFFSLVTLNPAQRSGCGAESGALATAEIATAGSRKVSGCACSILHLKSSVFLSRFSIWLGWTQGAASLGVPSVSVPLTSSYSSIASLRAQHVWLDLGKVLAHGLCRGWNAPHLTDGSSPNHCSAGQRSTVRPKFAMLEKSVCQWVKVQ